MGPKGRCLLSHHCCVGSGAVSAPPPHPTTALRGGGPLTTSTAASSAGSHQCPLLPVPGNHVHVLLFCCWGMEGEGLLPSSGGRRDARGGSPSLTSGESLSHHRVLPAVHSLSELARDTGPPDGTRCRCIRWTHHLPGPEEAVPFRPPAARHLSRPSQGQLTGHPLSGWRLQQGPEAWGPL